MTSFLIRKSPKPLKSHITSFVCWRFLSIFHVSWASLRRVHATWQSADVDDHRSRASARQQCLGRTCPEEGGQWQACEPSYPKPAAEAPHWCPEGPLPKARRRQRARWRRGLACISLHESSSCIHVSCPGTDLLSHRDLEWQKLREKREWGLAEFLRSEIDSWVTGEEMLLWRTTRFEVMTIALLAIQVKSRNRRLNIYTTYKETENMKMWYMILFAATFTFFDLQTFKCLPHNQYIIRLNWR